MILVAASVDGRTSFNCWANTTTYNNTLVSRWSHDYNTSSILYILYKIHPHKRNEVLNLDNSFWSEKFSNQRQRNRINLTHYPNNKIPIGPMNKCLWLCVRVLWRWLGGGWYQKCDLGPQKPCRFKYYRLINAFDTNSTLTEK